VSFQSGDRVRIVGTGDDGLPLVRYGSVGGMAGRDGPVVVMLDGELGGDIVDIGDLEAVTITSVELRLPGDDLFDEPALRRALASLWEAEADTAGLAIDALHPLAEPRRDASDSWVLAELVAGGEQYIVRATRPPNDPGVVVVRADRPNRWDW
jgi:hypothetical protein